MVSIINLWKCFVPKFSSSMDLQVFGNVFKTSQVFGYMARSAKFFLGHIFCLKNILGSSLFLEMFSFFVRNILQNYFSEMFYHFLENILGGASCHPKHFRNLLKTRKLFRCPCLRIKHYIHPCYIPLFAYNKSCGKTV